MDKTYRTFLLTVYKYIFISDLVFLFSSSCYAFSFRVALGFFFCFFSSFGFLHGFVIVLATTWTVEVYVRNHKTKIEFNSSDIRIIKSFHLLTGYIVPINKGMSHTGVNVCQQCMYKKTLFGVFYPS